MSGAHIEYSPRDLWLFICLLFLQLILHANTHKKATNELGEKKVFFHQMNLNLNTEGFKAPTLKMVGMETKQPSPTKHSKSSNYKNVSNFLKLTLTRAGLDFPEDGPQS